MKTVSHEGCSPAHVQTLTATDQRDRLPDGSLLDGHTITLEEYREMEKKRVTKE
jgi:hypothetical protein